MSDTNRVGVAIARASGSTFPLAAPDPLNLRSLRITGTPNLGFQPTTVVSNEIRSDRQIADLILVGAEAGGDGAFELSYGAFDDLIESALFNTFVETHAESGATDIDSFGTGTIVLDTGLGAGYKEGHLVELANEAAGLQGRGIYEITGISTDTLTVTPHTSDTNAVTSSFASQDAAPGSDLLATTLKVIGYRADANGEIALTVAGGVATLTASTGSNFDNMKGAALDLNVGDWIKLSGFPLSTSNVYARVTSIDEGADTITFVQPTGMVADAAASERPIIWFGDRVTNGAQAISSHQFVVERSFQDHSPVSREAFLGMALNQFNLQLQPQSIATASAVFFGLTASASNGENSGTGQGVLYGSGVVINRISSPANDVYNTSSNVGRLGRGATPIDTAGVNFVLEASVQINNNLRRQPAVGVFGASGIGAGELSVTGTLNTYFDNLDLLNAVLNNTETSLDITVRGTDGRAMCFDMPRIKFSDGAPDVPGKNQDVVINLSYQAILSSTFGYTIGVTRFPYVE